MRILFDNLLHYYPNFLIIFVMIRTFPFKSTRKKWTAAPLFVILAGIDWIKLFTFREIEGTVVYLVIQLLMIFLFICVVWGYAAWALSGWRLYKLTVIVMWWFFYETGRCIVLETTLYTGWDQWLFLIENNLLLTLFSWIIIKIRFNFEIRISPKIIIVQGFLSLFCEIFVYQGYFLKGSARNLAILIYILMSMIFVYWCVAVIVRQMAEIHARESWEQLQNVELENARRNYQEIRTIRHEIKNHMLTLSALLEKRNYEKLEVYFQEYRQENEERLDTVFSGNDIVDAVLNREIARARGRKIQIMVETKIPPNLRISMTDLAAVLFNALDNAIDASGQMEGARIQVDLQKIKNYISVRIANTVQGDILKENPELRTTKTERHCHGNGIRLIREICDKYEGDCEFSQEGSSFIMSVLLKERRTQDEPSEDSRQRT